MNVKTDKKVFVIVVTYKGRRWYDRCFTSLRESTFPLQTVVVDNASNDGSVEYLRENYPEIHLIESEENLGFGRANNMGMRYALDNGCDYVFLLNQDAWIEPDCIKRLIKIHTLHPDFGILSPMHLSREKDHLNIYLDDGNRNYELLSDFYFNSSKDFYPVKYVNAAAWLLPKTTLETVGGFDPIFVQYEEDDDYLNRAIYHGLGVVLCPMARVVHDHTDLQNTLTDGVKRHYQFILLDQIDPNKPLHLNATKRYFLRKALMNMLLGNMTRSRSFWSDYMYLNGKKKEIYISRNNNRQRKSSWI